ncbi:MAG TPA: RNA polymerase sigma-54 factor [Rhodospirillales bacterium]|nr:RNA polymerase sigma-54 factor [Rhodospirillales bacterium]
MALTPRLDLRQSQALVMTPQLQQAIKLLQLSNLELADYVEHELEQNPLLEHEEGRADKPDEAAPEAAPEDGDAALPDMDFTTDGGAGTETLDADSDNLWSGDSPSDSPAEPADGAFSATSVVDWGGGRGFDGAAPNLEETLSSKPSLRDHLLGQLAMETTDPAERMIGLHLIDRLDASGYINGRFEDLAARLGCTISEVERSLERLQHFDPPGIFARSLAECLGLQLREKNRLDPAMLTFLDNLDLVAKRDLARLGKICGVDAEDIADMVAEIRDLDPKPALAFDPVQTQLVTPDVLMRARPGGGWRIELNNDTLPRVLVNNVYHASVRLAARNKEEKKYISDCLQSANWLVKSLHQRATTILKVATEIVRQQEGFFIKGVLAMRPLVLRDIADEIEMHESTVSRVTSNKYIATPRGIFELKYFFTTAIGSVSGGDSYSAESVRHRIKALINGEDTKKILSDDKIVSLLKAEGIDIARRTVAKYREAIGFPSSVQRRREKSVTL